MYIVKKLFRVPMGHRLSKHKGLCQNVHGHNLKMEIQLSSHQLNDNDMVIDFGDLKKLISGMIDEFDHTMVLNPDDLENLSHYTALGYRLKTISPVDSNTDPTAEVLCEYLYYRVRDVIRTGISVDFIHIWENDNSMAGYYAT